MNTEQEDLQPDTDGQPTDEDNDLQAAEADAPPSRPARRPGIPAWTLGLLVLALTVVLVWAGNAFIRSRQQRTAPVDLPAPSATAAPQATRAPTATPAPTAAPADAAQVLILVANLFPDDGGAYPDADLTELLYKSLIAGPQGRAALETGAIRIERLDQQVPDADAARSAGKARHASYVVWGRDARRGAEPHLQRIGAQTRTRTVPQGHDLTLSEPTQHALCTFTEAPGQIDAAVYAIRGIAAYDAGLYDTAETDWDQATEAAQPIEGCALDAVLHLYRGNAHAFQGDYDAALAAFDAALAADSALVLAYVNRGSVHYVQGSYEAALDDLTRALELDPDTANAYYQRANVYRALEQPADVLADLNRALELDPEHARAYASRALIRHNEGDHEAALDDYTQALELDPDAAEVYLNRGGTYASLGQFEAALEDYAQALKLNPDDADAYYNRGTVYAMLETYDQALADLNRALALKPDFAQVYGNRGLVYKAMGDTEKAVADLERFLEMSDNPQWRQMIEQQLAELKEE